MDEQINCTPPELRQIAVDNLKNLLPTKSQHIYEKEYGYFLNWCNKNNVVNITENVMIAYFDEESKVKKASSLWSKYSMLRSCLNIYKRTDISKFSRLLAYLKRLSEGYEPKKSKILEIEHINRFIIEADDKIYLAMKVILIMGYNGACRREEITNIMIDDIEYKDNVIVVCVPKTKTHIPRKFIITEKLWIELVKKYYYLRPSHITHKRFFLQYRNGSCINSPIGINTVGKVPKNIATFLKLCNPELFTGHCFRRSSVTHLANSGGDLITIKRHGGWKSSAVAEGYIDVSIKKKVEVAQILSGASNMFPKIIDNSATSNAIGNNVSFTVNQEGVKQNIMCSQNLPGISINTYESSNVTVNVYNNCTTSNK